ncbi:MAG: hypothetical protein M1820_009177 [Bogoriella megaspora]|nr:MAG: hypothetical protein M1820_009177 [Bogoriella megaspora]
MASKDPVVVIVPGAWTAPVAYRKLRSALEAKGFNVHIPALPTNNGVRPPNSSYEADVAAVHETLEPLVHDGHLVLMLMHSYGGAVGTDAAQGLARKEREARDLPGGIVHLVYLSAYLLSEGQSVWTIVEKSGIAQGQTGLVTIEEDGTWLPNNPISGMYHDLDEADQQEQKDQIKPHNLSSLYGVTKYEAWKDIPSTYVRTTEDRWVPPLFQDLCLENPKNAGVSVNEEVFHCAHSAYAKYPNEVADIVVKALNSG